MTIEGMEKVEDVIRRERKLPCKNCGKEITWTGQEEIKAIRVAMDAEKEAFQAYSRMAKMTRNSRGRDMFQQLSEFEMNHYKKLGNSSNRFRKMGNGFSIRELP